MTDTEGAKPPAPGTEPVKPAPKRARKRTAKPKAVAPPAPAPEAPQPTAKAPPKAPVEAPPPLNELIMAQTAESLASLSANLTHAMTRANKAL